MIVIGRIWLVKAPPKNFPEFLLGEQPVDLVSVRPGSYLSAYEAAGNVPFADCKRLADLVAQQAAEIAALKAELAHPSRQRPMVVALQAQLARRWSRSPNCNANWPRHAETLPLLPSRPPATSSSRPSRREMRARSASAAGNQGTSKTCERRSRPRTAMWSRTRSIAVPIAAATFGF